MNHISGTPIAAVGLRAADRRKKIAYVLSTYPELTTTFIEREIREADRIGLDLSVVVIERPTAQTPSPSSIGSFPEVRYVLPDHFRRLSYANLYCLCTRFPTYVRTLAYLLSREHPNWKSRAKTFAHFVVGVLAADILRRSETPEHLHAHFADRTATVTIVVSRLLEIPYSLTAHAYDIYRSPTFLRDKIQGAKFATTCTAFNKAYLESSTGCGVELVYHGLDFSHMPLVSDERRSVVPLILAVGRLQEKKGFNYLIEACKELRTKGHEFRCEIIGEGPYRELLAGLIRKLDLQENVVLCGAMPNSEVLAKCGQAAVFVLPSCITGDGDRDGIPNVILEAMAFGVPVVSTSVSGIPEVVRDGETGLLVSPRNVEQLGIAIERVLVEPNLARDLGERGKRLVLRNFDVRQNVQRLVQLLDA